MSTVPNQLELTESRTMRDRNVGRLDALDRVKTLVVLDDGVHVTVEMAATYFGVEVEAVKWHIRSNRDELLSDGMQVLRGPELREFERESNSPSKRRSLTLLPRRAMLRLAMLLRDSDVAKDIRTYLLDVEEIATPEQKATAIEKAAMAEAQLRAIEVLARIDGNTSYARSLSRHVAARMLGEEPELDPADITITCDEYLKSKGLADKDLDSARTRLGKTVAALYRARYSRDPQKIQRPIRGVHRDVAVYTHRDIALFDTAWSELARHYSLQQSLPPAEDAA